ncbi:Bgt-4826 [Blumeria graminis f. sp. tritici]|uniref:Bgt-4826 n=2 Tax=Blumeria graminis f. sp. tritici TaxID=62690 RepID=A0A061HFE6_BLUGR|nr:hypothetical protein BGT96224_4826 [Blumeria graminis f. sp. tritici 96224]VDB83782.1 Bgt-4826 [Blumeria graminis f. sp. tritici]
MVLSEEGGKNAILHKDKSVDPEEQSTLTKSELQIACDEDVTTNITNLGHSSPRIGAPNLNSNNLTEYNNSNKNLIREAENVGFYSPTSDSHIYSEHKIPCDDTYMDSINEVELHKHLNDVEPSFMPIASPTSINNTLVTDGPYIFDRSSPILESSPKDCFPLTLTPGPNTSRGEKLRSETTNQISLDNSWNPPVINATIVEKDSRIVSSTGTSEVSVINDKINTEEQYKAKISKQNRREVPDDGPGCEDSEASSEHSTIRHHISGKNLRNMGDSQKRAEDKILPEKGSNRPKKFLQVRNISRNSSVSSLDAIDVALGADYALQSGGAVPAVEVSRQSSTTLSRSISLGSIASGFDDSAEYFIQAAGNCLPSLTEREKERKGNDGISPPKTPRARSKSLAPPTDTVIARRVRNVHVPEAIVKEYRSKNGMASPARYSSTTGPTPSRSGKNLTLKEQSSSIERLSKENFDLKLKVMFLSDRLDKLSEESVKDMISENVEMKTSLAVMQRDNKALRRKIKELEKQLKTEEDRPSTSHSSINSAETPNWFNEQGNGQMEELMYLREKVEEYVTEIEKLRSESISRENEKRNLAEIVRQMGERRGHDLDTRGEIDILKDLLEKESDRFEQIDDENKRLREENFFLKIETSSNSGDRGHSHTTIESQNQKRSQKSPRRPASSMSGRYENHNDSISAGSTLVDELKRESEKLKHENAELRREVGAQTSMLTSRNREKERLYQEIEDLKLEQRRGLAVSDTLLDRSSSRTHQRSLSRASSGTKHTNINCYEREDFENKNAELRDEINRTKIKYQDLQRELTSCTEDFEIAVSQKIAVEKFATEIRESLEQAQSDMLTMQAERNEALQGQEEAETMFESLRREAQQELDSFALYLDEANSEIGRLRIELSDTTENFNSLQSEMREMSQSLIRLEDDQSFSVKRIQNLEKELEEANHELEQLEKNLVEANEKVSCLTVQQESGQGEIAFLREEQEGDKIKIGNLEATIKTSELALDEGKERIKVLEQRLSSERSQREAIAGKEKQEVQQYVNQLNCELSSAKDEVKRLRKKDVEAAEWKQKLVDLEEQLRIALGEIDGTRSSFLHSIAKLHHELEDTVHDLDSAKESMAQKDRIIKDRDERLEANALEARKLADMLDKERQYHRNTKHQFETFQKTTQHTTRTLTQQKTRITELETARQQDRRKIITIENQFKDQVADRNQLLLTLWRRLSDICGIDWTHDNSLINGRALPTMESLTTMFPGFSKNIISAVKKIESVLTDFTSRIHSIEKDLWKEYQTLMANLEARTKRLDHLEISSRGIISGIGGDGRIEINRLREQIKTMQTEILTLRAASEARMTIHQDGTTSSSMENSPRVKMGDKARNSNIRQNSMSLVEATDQICRQRNDSESRAGVDRDYQSYSDPKWITRLYELEEKYKAEREARIMDRTAARQRLEEKSKDNEELLQEIEKLRVKMKMSR